MKKATSQQPPNSPGCRVSQVSVTIGEHHETQLKEDEEYFFVLSTPKTRSSFVHLSGFATAARRAQPSGQNLLSSQTDAPRDDSEAGTVNPAPGEPVPAGAFGMTTPRSLCYAYSPKH